MADDPRRVISVIGLGYIGLPTAAVLASRKIQVIGVDVNADAVEAVNRGEIHILEPDLGDVVSKAVAAGYLRATSAPEPADAFVITVPTPVTASAEPDLSYIESAADAIAPVLLPGNLVILESTSPVGTTEQMAEWLAKRRPDLSFPHQQGEESEIRIAHCPERVLPGRILRELVHNDRVVGGMTQACSRAASNLYEEFVEGRIFITDVRTAEMCKLVENSFRDVNIAFANELSMICESQAIDVWELIRLANLHPRVQILQPGPGVGGHCIAVDPWFIVNKSPDLARLIRCAREINDSKPGWVIDQVVKAMRAPGAPHWITCFGLTFKPDVDDLRESPALGIASHLAALFPGRVLAVEPNIHALPSHLSALLELTTTDDERCAQSLGILLVDHAEFRAARPPSGPFLDFKGIWRPAPRREGRDPADPSAL